MSAVERCYWCQNFDSAIAQRMQTQKLSVHQVFCEHKCFNVSCPNGEVTTPKKCKACFAQYCSKTCRNQDALQHALICADLKPFCKALSTEEPVSTTINKTHARAVSALEPLPKPVKRAPLKASDSPITPKLKELYRTRHIAQSSESRDICLHMESFDAALACMEIYETECAKRPSKTLSLLQAGVQQFRTELHSATMRLQHGVTPADQLTILDALNSQVEMFLQRALLPPSL